MRFLWNERTPIDPPGNSKSPFHIDTFIGIEYALEGASHTVKGVISYSVSDKYSKTPFINALFFITLDARIVHVLEPKITAFSNMKG